MPAELGKIPHYLRRIALWVKALKIKSEQNRNTQEAVVAYLRSVQHRIYELEIKMQGDVKKALRGLEAQRDAALLAQSKAEKKTLTAQQAQQVAETAQAQSEKDKVALQATIDAQAPFLMNQDDLTETQQVLASLPPDTGDTTGGTGGGDTTTGSGGGDTTGTTPTAPVSTTNADGTITTVTTNTDGTTTTVITGADGTVISTVAA